MLRARCPRSSRVTPLSAFRTCRAPGDASRLGRGRLPPGRVPEIAFDSRGFRCLVIRLHATAGKLWPSAYYCSVI